MFAMASDDFEIREDEFGKIFDLMKFKVEADGRIMW